MQITHRSTDAEDWIKCLDIGKLGGIESTFNNSIKFSQMTTIAMRLLHNIIIYNTMIRNHVPEPIDASGFNFL